MKVTYQKYWGFYEVIDDSIGITVSKGRFSTEAEALEYIANFKQEV